jgi:hypothetical protein
MNIFLKYLKKIISNYTNDKVYRLDNKKIDNFNLDLKTYEHTNDWTISGVIPHDQKPKKGFRKSTGLFAGDLFAIAPYASPRGTRFLKYEKTIVFDKKDENDILLHKPILTTFNKKDFEELKFSKEFFAHKKNNKDKIEIIKQEKIKNSIEFMKKQGYTVSFVDDLKMEKERLEKEGFQVDHEGDL